ncbi:MAG: single-stranded DNA-binding protein [Chloroflexota bacterium]
MLEMQFIGNLGKDPEARYTPDGVLVVNFSVAVTPRKDETVWVEVTAWRELGERCHQYLKKGRQVFVRGVPTVEAFKRKTGEPGAALKVTAQMVQFLGGKNGDAAGQPTEQAEDDIPF